MAQVLQTEEFEAWFDSLNDRDAQRRIDARINAIQTADHFGNAKRLSSTVSELKIDFGPGYRLYYTMRGPVVVILLCGGDKSSQKRDVKRAEKIASSLED
jgi:putative addiction module killer protein